MKDDSTFHGVRFPTPSLSVCEYTYIIPIDTGMDERTYVPKYGILLGIGFINLIETELLLRGVGGHILIAKDANPFIVQTRRRHQLVVLIIIVHIHSVGAILGIGSFP